MFPPGVRGTRTGSYGHPISAGRPQRTWTWGPRGQGAILLVNCDKDDPKSPSRDCMDGRVYDRDGTDHGNRASSFYRALCAAPGTCP